MGGTVGKSEFLRLLLRRGPVPGVMLVDVPFDVVFELDATPADGVGSTTCGELGGLEA